MKTKRIILIMMLFSIFFQSCIYDYTPDNTDYENRLVVYGLITNDLKNIEVTLSRTTNISTKEFIPEISANLVVESMSGEQIQLYEFEEGKYFSAGPYQGKVGESYKLKIETINDEKYESDFQKLEEPVGISNLSHDFFFKQTTDIDNPLWGCEIYADIKVGDDSNKYFRIDLEETWKVGMPLRAIYFVDADDVQSTVNLSPACWLDEKPEEYFVFGTSDFGSNQINKFPVKFVSVETTRLSLKYSLNVNLYTLSEPAYAFWKAQSDNIASSSLYTTQPGRVYSNIKNVNATNEQVIGFFEASSKSSKRIFITNEELIPSAQYLSFCRYSRRTPTRHEKEIGYYIQDFGSFNGGVYVVDAECVVCEESGASSIKPSFWED